MIDFIESLVPATVSVFDTEASEAGLADLPYVLLLGGEGVRSAEESVHGRDAADGDLTVRVVGSSRASVLGVLRVIRNGMDRQTLANEQGRHTFILDNHRPPRADTSATIPGTSLFPLMADDEYTILTSKE